ncbi:hypothetical protein CORT_0C04110 [Candida orthopsilosis Co 90-125]|uniref:DUF202 domain-containing protein n=1 Tax=Candida orthopsilosis (strain 90-125) TaxID=1136231 RepID=H8X3Z6_CANO9|nr:hypothetical protein CORT_0C04110 [Candida orthopsilosis Co 90-125]CCG25784.1 hypothetical protein CORT_0C04110 [Candida orthopsilosis Co 90-125]
MTSRESTHTQDEKELATTSTLKEIFNFQINLPNKGSVARDHLANERTFLSWTRTSLVFVTFGIGFMQFYRLEEKSQCPQISQPLPHPDSTTSSSTSLFNHNISNTVIALCRPIGGMCIILGILTILFGMYRYFTVQRALMKQEFPVTRLTVVVLLLINLGILILLLVLNFKVSL